MTIEIINSSLLGKFCYTINNELMKSTNNETQVSNGKQTKVRHLKFRENGCCYTNGDIIHNAIH